MNIFVLIICLQVGQIISQDVNNSLEPSDLVIVIMSQSNPYHKAHAELLQKNIYTQADSMEKDYPIVILAHELQIKGSWTFLPLLPHLSYNYLNKKWFLFCLENTVFNLQELIKVLSEYKSKNMWVSYGLTDHDLTIIHHFAKLRAPFKYPNEASAFAMTKDLLSSIVTNQESRQMEFSIDPSHELAHYIDDVIKGPTLTHSSKFCVVSNRKCATFPRQFYPCDKPISSEKIYVAVKTCKQFRNDRIPIILKTWSKYAKHIGFYTDEEDNSLKNFHVVPKTNSGHCAKTYQILQHAYKVMSEKNIDWLLITDDDTILSLARIQKLLTCYNANDPVALGQRYGFRLNDDDGYDYLTSGAGLVLSKPVIKLMINSSHCECPHRETADDMFLFGLCLQNIHITLTHSPGFHQARAIDYAAGYISSSEPVSFHSFWNINPEEIYKQWFAEDDEHFFHSSITHTEL